MHAMRICVSFCVFGLLWFCGCGKPGAGIERSVHLSEVKGRVTLADGTPLPGGVVRFIPAPKGGSDDEATGEIQADGSFALSTRKLNDGAAPGEYKVRIEATSPRTLKEGVAIPEIPRKYLDEDTSGLKAVVKSGPTELPAFVLQ